jgi:predicted RNA binding protein YcfA (HicA-like mRNA interferase family)
MYPAKMAGLYSRGIKRDHLATQVARSKFAQRLSVVSVGHTPCSTTDRQYARIVCGARRHGISAEVFLGFERGPRHSPPPGRGVIVKFVELVRLLESNGFTLMKEKGSIRYYGKQGWDKLVRVDYHGSKEVPTGTCHAILKAAGIKKSR